MPDKKSWMEVVLMPLVIAAVGILGTMFITAQQERGARMAGDSQLASAKEMATADRQVKILEIFAEKVASSDQGQKLLALRMLRAIDPDLAEKLALAVAEGEPEQSPVRIVANQVAQEAVAQASLLPRIFVHIRSEEDRAQAKQLGEKLSTQGFNVPGVERLVDRGPSTTQLRYFRQSELGEAKAIADSLKKSGVDVSLQYIQGYEESDVVRPHQYELWFPAGQPRK